MRERSNERWLAALRARGPERNAAIEDLRALLVRGMGYALAKFPNVSAADLEDFGQEAVLRILGNLDSFRGQSRFLTWAHKIAIRVAYSELRRARWRDVPLQMPQDHGKDQFVPDTIVDPDAGPEALAVQPSVLEVVRRTIRDGLTDRQRQAMVAVVVQGVPLEEVARRMDTNRNALYKLLHDARRRLQRRLAERGLSMEEILAALS